MKRVSKMVLAMYAPAAMATVGGIALAEGVGRMGSVIGAHAAYRGAAWLWLLAMLVGLSWAGYVSWRLYRWLRGRELRCECGGMLSKPRVARDGSRYRKCMGCGTRVMEE